MFETVIATPAPTDIRLRFSAFSCSIRRQLVADNGKGRSRMPLYSTSESVSVVGLLRGSTTT